MKTFALKLSVYSLNNQKHFFKLTSPVNKFSDFPKDSLYLYIYSPKDVFCINSHFCATIKFLQNWWTSVESAYLCLGQRQVVGKLCSLCYWKILFLVVFLLQGAQLLCAERSSGFPVWLVLP